MLRNLLIALPTLLSLLLGAPAHAAVADDIQVLDAKVRLVPPVTPNTAIFMTLYNPGDKEEFLVGASTPIAKTAELHMHIHDNGVMRMRRIPHIHLPPHTDVHLKRGGLHVMLFGLTQPLKAGDKVKVELEFGDGSHKTVEAVVGE